MKKARKKMLTVQDQIDEKIDILKQIYQSSGMAQEAMSKEIGVNRQTINNWLARRSSPKAQLQINAIDQFIGKYSYYLGK